MSGLVVPAGALGRLKPLGRGGTARVYQLLDFALPGYGDLVYKEYLTKIRTMAGPALGSGLLALVEFQDRLQPGQRRLWDQRVIWPLRLVGDDSGAAVGIIMQLIPATFFVKLREFSGVTSAPAEVDRLFGSDADARALHLTVPAVRDRIALCAQAARTYGLMHRADVVVGDLSGRNLLYDVSGPVPRTLVIDTDSARIRGTRSAFGNQPHTPGWEPPEALTAARQMKSLLASKAPARELQRLADAAMTQSMTTDVYKFGLLVVRLLDNGRQRSANRDPTVARQILVREVGNAAAGILLDTLQAEPSSRPTMRDWYEVMSGRSSSASSAPKQDARATRATPRTSGEWRWVEGKGWVRKQP